MNWSDVVFRFASRVIGGKMPYCVHCGVELAPSEPKCPLCSTEVMIPDYQPDVASDPFPLEVQPALPAKVNASLVLLISVLEFIGAMVSVTVDLSISRGLSWSPLVLTSLALVWMLSAFPLLMLRRRPFYTLALMALAIAGFLLMLDLLIGWDGWSIVAASAVVIGTSILLVPFKVRIARGIPAALVDGGLIALSLFLIERFYASGRWFLPLGLPLAILSTVYLAMVSLLFPRIRRLPYRRIPLLLLVTGGYNVGIELIINAYTQVLSRGISWSIYVFLSLMIPAGLIYYLGQNRKLRHHIKKRLHI